MSFALDRAGVAILAGLVQEAAVLVLADLTAQKSRTILGSTELRTKHPITIHGAINSRNAQGSCIFGGIGDVDADTLIRSTRLRFADDNLLNLSILTEIVRATESSKKGRLVFHGGYEADDIDQVLLLDTDTG